MKKTLLLKKMVAINILLILFTLVSYPKQSLRVKPEQVGISSQRLVKLEQVMNQYIKDNKGAGIVTMIVRDGKVAHLKSYGKANIAKNMEMPTDAIFRIASQSKAITSVAIMMLYEEGKLLLSDPVSKYIPEYKNTTVAVTEPGKEGYQIVPAKREITIKDLLTHTSGISYGNGVAKEIYKTAGLSGWKINDHNETIAVLMKRLATLPFDAQPGEKFVYGFNTDLLGYIVEVVSGMPLDEFIKKRITEPLAMVDTSFFLSPDKVSRLTASYGISENGELFLTDDPEKSTYVVGPKKCFSGGAGLLSTAEDYARFMEMLRRGGELDGVRLLSPKSVQLMTVNHVGTLFEEQGFGLGFEILQDLGKNVDLGSVGTFSWSGAYHTAYWVDPVEKMSVLLMIQLLPARGSDMRSKFKALVYQSLIKSYQ